MLSNIAIVLLLQGAFAITPMQSQSLTNARMEVPTSQWTQADSMDDARILMQKNGGGGAIEVTSTGASLADMSLMASSIEEQKKEEELALDAGSLIRMKINTEGEATRDEDEIKDSFIEQRTDNKADHEKSAGYLKDRLDKNEATADEMAGKEPQDATAEPEVSSSMSKSSRDANRHAVKKASTAAKRHAATSALEKSSTGAMEKATFSVHRMAEGALHKDQDDGFDHDYNKKMPKKAEAAEEVGDRATPEDQDEAFAFLELETADEIAEEKVVTRDLLTVRRMGKGGCEEITKRVDLDQRSPRPWLTNPRWQTLLEDGVPGPAHRRRSRKLKCDCDCRCEWKDSLNACVWSKKKAKDRRGLFQGGMGVKCWEQKC